METQSYSHKISDVRESRSLRLHRMLYLTLHLPTDSKIEDLPRFQRTSNGVYAPEFLIGVEDSFPKQKLVLKLMGLTQLYVLNNNQKMPCLAEIGGHLFVSGGKNIDGTNCCLRISSMS